MRPSCYGGVARGRYVVNTVVLNDSGLGSVCSFGETTGLIGIYLAP